MPVLPRISFIPITILVSYLVTAFAVATPPEEPSTQQSISPTLTGQLGLPYSDHAILQQKIPLRVWGSACLPNSKVTVRFNGQELVTTTDGIGAWKVTLEPMNAEKLQSTNDAPKGYEMVITFEKDGKQASTTLKNLLIGEVWLCAGQSNIAGKMRKNTRNHFPQNSLKVADYPAFRQLSSEKDAKWLVCTPKTAAEFKKVCFFFGRRVSEETLVPVGVISAAVGGSKIESWLNEDPYETGEYYTKMIEPLIPFGIRGVIWYQGESNAEPDGYGYLPKLTSLINGWRNAWMQPESEDKNGPRKNFSTYFVQLPGIGKSDENNPEMGDGRAGIRRAYFDALHIENTGMAVCHDIGAGGEHPPNKYDTGFRLAQLALHHDYGQKELIVSGPLYKSSRVEGDSMRIHFDYADGLMVANKEGFLPAKPTQKEPLGWLSIQSKDGTWHWANGEIDGSELIVSSPNVTEPVAVRYAYTNNPNGPLLYNKDGLPAAPFATDEQAPLRRSRSNKVIENGATEKGN